MDRDYYAIEVFGWNDCYCAIKKVRTDGWVVPTNREAYLSIADAQADADKMGLEIEKIGGFYEIISKGGL